jgi:hypothetical protein
VTGRLEQIIYRHLETWAGMNGHSVERLLREVGVQSLDAVITKFLEDASFLLSKTTKCGVDELMEVLLSTRPLIMEGSQGLALDPGVGCLPHLTPSHVGVGGLVEFFHNYFYFIPREIELIYATRPYLTRHGAGPLQSEELWTLPVKDETNVPNPWQETLRTAPMNFMQMRQNIVTDLRWMSLWPKPIRRPTLHFSVGVTCCDHVENEDFQFFGLTGETKRGLAAFLNECDLLIDELSLSGERGRLITCFGEERVDTHESEVQDARVA